MINLDDMWASGSFEEQNRVNRAAVLKLIDAHREEYDQLTGRFAEERAHQLEEEIRKARVTLKELRALNPDGIQVPAIQQTTKMLVEENDTLSALVRKKDKEIESLKAKLKKFTDAVKGA